MAKKTKPGQSQLRFLRLFLAGDEPNSALARKNLERIVKQNSIDPSLVEVVDVYEDHRTALDNKVLLTPTLLIGLPGSVTRVVGNLQDVDSLIHQIEAA
ncbi:circadian clock KaiB family protein [Desulfoferula mesophila]|uniref:KaiB domain-containing protein n=1 Tax=Desulfoferula mesophila TaxID=3058419 RepID=A0AAU9EFQ2_9BACT|nr:hypothetical protein FAK_23880 [Desulfoferula mesophilus]